MEGLRSGTKLYRWRYNENILETVIFKRFEQSMFVVQKENGEEKRLSESSFNLKYCLSKIMVLTEAEEIMRLQLLNVHSMLREMKANFNPISSVDEVKISYGNPVKEVHQYHLKTGRYIKSFLSMSDASRALGMGYKYNGHLSHVCHGRRKSAYGFRWSFNKVEILS